MSVCSRLQSCPCQKTKNFEQIHGLAVMLSIPRLTTSKNIDEISTRYKQPLGKSSVTKHFFHMMKCIIAQKRMRIVVMLGEQQEQ